MRVFCVCLCLLALTSTICGDDAATSPTTAAPGAAAPQVTSTTVASTTTQTTTSAGPTRTSTGLGAQTIQQWLITGETIPNSNQQFVECAKVNTAFKTPTDYQLANECLLNQHVEVDDGFVYVKEANAKDEEYQCCIDTSKICPKKDKPYIKSGSDKPVECDLSLKNVCPLKTVCHKNFDKDPKEKEAFQNMMGMQNDYSIGDICCARTADRSATCDKKPSIKEYDASNDVCLRDKGRCGENGKFGVCTQTDYSPDLDSSCCEVAEQDLCPGKLLPFAFNIVENKTTGPYESHYTAFDYRFAKAISDAANGFMKDRCREIKDHGGAYLYPSDDTNAKQCCPVAELGGKRYVLTVNMTYEMYSKTPCDGNNKCSDASLYCGPAKDPTQGYDYNGRMCFPRVKCPHVQGTVEVYSNPNTGGDDLNCTLGLEGQCANGDICVSMMNGRLGVCCSATTYSYKCPAGEGGPEAEGNGVAVQKAQCVNDPNDKYVHKSVKIDEFTNICCRWNKAGAAAGSQGPAPSVPPGYTGSVSTVKPKASSGECQNNGKYFLDSQNLPKECGASAKEAGRCEGKGVCRKSSRNQKLYCCDENRCPTDNYTPMDGLGKCDDSEGCKHLSKAMKEKYCQKDKKGDSKCCPIPAATGNKVHPDVQKENIKSFELAGMKCKDVDDCGGHGKYCKDSVCWNYGSNSVVNNVKCSSNDECKKDGKITYHCLKMGSPNDHGSCAHHTKVVDAKKTGIKLGYVVGAIVNALFAIVFGLLAVVMFLKYRSKNFCDQRKPSKKDKKKKSKKSEKTETTGGDTTGGTTSKADK